jgi:hypothetical protein
MEPNEALGIAAQVAVALAGFAGVVVVFKPDSAPHLSRLDRTRLQLLLHNSICPLAYALFGMLLLTAKPAPDSIWRWCSAFALLFQAPGAFIAFRNARHLTPEEYRNSNKLLLYSIGTMGFLTLLLQVYNVTTLNLFWPFFLSIVTHLVAGMLQFVRMVMLHPDKD